MPSGSDRKAIRLGALALTRLTRAADRSFPNWVVVSDGLREGMAETAKELRWNSPDSSSTVFNRAFKDWRGRNKLFALDQAPGGKVTMSRLLWLTDPERREHVLAWFNHLLPGQQIRLHTPDSVYMRYRKEMFERERMEDLPKPKAAQGHDVGPDKVTPLVDVARQTLSAFQPLKPLRLSDNDDIAATLFLDTYGDRAASVLNAIRKMIRSRHAKR